VHEILPESRPAPRPAWLTCAACAVLACFAVTTPARATESGGSVYPFGLNTVATGILPQPGNYLYLYNTVFEADVTRDGDGRAVPIPFDVEVRAHTLRFLQVLATPRVLGGQVGWLLAQPYLVGDAEIGPRTDDGSGFGDTTFGVMLGWHGPQRHWMTGVDVILPTGSYSSDRLFNPGRNQYAAIGYGALTTKLGERWNANLRANLIANGENRDTNYRSGLESGLEYSVNWIAAPGWQLGVNGYLYDQLTDDRRDGQSVADDGRQGRVFAYGPQVVYRAKRWGVAAKWQHEDGARNRAEGDKYWLQGYVGL
jgi:hypothetical protein